MRIAALYRHRVLQWNHRVIEGSVPCNAVVISDCIVWPACLNGLEANRADSWTNTLTRRGCNFGCNVQPCFPSYSLDDEVSSGVTPRKRQEQWELTATIALLMRWSRVRAPPGSPILNTISIVCEQRFSRLARRVWLNFGYAVAQTSTLLRPRIPIQTVSECSRRATSGRHQSGFEGRVTRPAMRAFRCDRRCDRYKCAGGCVPLKPWRVVSAPCRQLNSGDGAL